MKITELKRASATLAGLQMELRLIWLVLGPKTLQPKPATLAGRHSRRRAVEAGKWRSVC
jgi:hypothetical protein